VGGSTATVTGNTINLPDGTVNAAGWSMGVQTATGAVTTVTGNTINIAETQKFYGIHAFGSGTILNASGNTLTQTGTAQDAYGIEGKNQVVVALDANEINLSGAVGGLCAICFFDPGPRIGGGSVTNNIITTGAKGAGAGNNSGIVFNHTDNPSTVSGNILNIGNSAADHVVGIETNDNAADIVVENNDITVGNTAGLNIYAISSFGNSAAATYRNNTIVTGTSPNTTYGIYAQSNTGTMLLETNDVTVGAGNANSYGAFLAGNTAGLTVRGGAYRGAATNTAGHIFGLVLDGNGDTLVENLTATSGDAKGASYALDVRNSITATTTTVQNVIATAGQAGIAVAN